MKASVFADAAVVTGITVNKVEGKKTEVDFRFTDTFVKRQDGWHLVATQEAHVGVWLTRKMEDSELKSLAIQACSQEPSAKSLDSNSPTFLRFKNSTSQLVTIYWLNYDGKRDPQEHQIRKVGPGKSLDTRTYVTHPFLVTDVSGRCMGIYEPNREASLAVIK